MEKTNKLIAEFMGLNKKEFKSGLINYYHIDYHDYDNKYHWTWYEADELSYDASWDWLMPVVQKIEQNCEGVPQELLNVSLYSNMKEVYNAVVEFIKDQNN